MATQLFPFRHLENQSMTGTRLYPFRIWLADLGGDPPGPGTPILLNGAGSLALSFAQAGSVAAHVKRDFVGVGAASVSSVDTGSLHAVAVKVFDVFASVGASFSPVGGADVNVRRGLAGGAAVSDATGHPGVAGRGLVLPGAAVPAVSGSFSSPGVFFYGTDMPVSASGGVAVGGSWAAFGAILVGESYPADGFLSAAGALSAPGSMALGRGLFFEYPTISESVAAPVDAQVFFEPLMGSGAISFSDSVAGDFNAAEFVPDSPTVSRGRMRSGGYPVGRIAKYAVGGVSEKTFKVRRL